MATFYHAQSSPLERQSSEWSHLKKTFVSLFAIVMALVGISSGNLARASEKPIILDYICTTYESARHVALEQSWQKPKSMPGDCRILFQQPFDLRAAEILQVIEILAVGDGRWIEIGRVRRSWIETGYSAGLAEDLFLF